MKTKTPDKTPVKTPFIEPFVDHWKFFASVFVAGIIVGILFMLIILGAHPTKIILPGIGEFDFPSSCAPGLTPTIIPPPTTVPPTVTSIPTVEKTNTPEPTSTPQSSTFFPQDKGGQLSLGSCISWRPCQTFSYATGRNSTTYSGTVSADYFQNRYEIDRLFLYFDTSRLPQNSQITNATLKLCSVGKPPVGNATIYIVQSEASPQYQDTDFNKFSITPNDVSVTFDEINQCKIITLTSAALKWVIPNGITKFAILHNYDYNNVTPIAVNAVYLGLYGNPDYHPALEVKFYTP